MFDTASVGRHLVGLALALGVAAASAFLALVAVLWGFALKCDDSCSTARGWREDPNAWEWSAFGWVGIGGFVAALLVLIAIALRRKLVAWFALALWGICGVVYLRLLSGSGLTSHEPRGWVALAALAVAAGIAVELMNPRARGSSR